MQTAGLLRAENSKVFVSLPTMGVDLRCPRLKFTGKTREVLAAEVQRLTTMAELLRARQAAPGAAAGAAAGDGAAQLQDLLSQYAALPDTQMKQFSR